jgi:ribosome biogenesis protein ERB1
VIVLCIKSCYNWIIEVFTVPYLFFSVWEIATGRCVRTIPVGGVVRSVSWCPNQALSLIAVAADRKVLLVNPGVGDHLICSKTDSLLDEPPEQDVIGKV